MYLVHRLLHVGGTLSKLCITLIKPILPSIETYHDRFTQRVINLSTLNFSSPNPCSKAVMKKTFARAATLGTLDKGDYYEFGVFKGYTLWCAQSISRSYKQKKFRLFGFDSFKGLPEIDKPEDTGEFLPGQYACSIENVSHNILSHHGSMKNLKLIKGFFRDSLTKKLKQTHKFRPGAIILIDCDLYSSTVTVLEYMKDLLMKDTLILFDDWNAFNANDSQGERKAFHEFLQNNRQLRIVEDFSFCWHGQAFRVLQTDH
jgi:O-methyltransferase